MKNLLFFIHFKIQFLVVHLLYKQRKRERVLIVQKQSYFYTTLLPLPIFMSIKSFGQNILYIIFDIFPSFFYNIFLFALVNSERTETHTCASDIVQTQAKKTPVMVQFKVVFALVCMNVQQSPSSNESNCFSFENSHHCNAFCA